MNHIITATTDQTQDEHKPGGRKSQQEEKNTIFLMKTCFLRISFILSRHFFFLKEEAKMQLEKKA